MSDGGGSRWPVVVLWLCAALAGACPPAVAAQPMLPRVYAGEAEIAGWLMSEKLDGVRGHWDGDQLFSKNGHRLYPPASFIAGLPPFALEGELWAGRGCFEQAVSTVLRQKPHAGWRELRFGIFDVPEAPGPFVDRLQRARAWFAEHPSEFAFVIAQTPVRDAAHLRQELQRVEALGGEGLIVRDPDARYAAGRSARILKVKSHRDAEATVVAHLPGKGRNAGRLGSLLVELEDGTRFRLGTGFSDAQRERPPPVGAVVTFKFYGTYRSGIPKFPAFLRVRRDSGL